MDDAPTRAASATVRLPIATRHPESYVLVNEADGTRWRGTAQGGWRAEAPATDAQAEAPVPVDVPGTCRWAPDPDFVFATGCGQMHVFVEGGVADNGYRYCPYCGASIVDASPEDAG